MTQLVVAEQKQEPGFQGGVLAAASISGCAPPPALQHPLLRPGLPLGAHLVPPAPGCGERAWLRCCWCRSWLVWQRASSLSVFIGRRKVGMAPLRGQAHKGSFVKHKRVLTSRTFSAARSRRHLSTFL